MANNYQILSLFSLTGSSIIIQFGLGVRKCSFKIDSTQRADACSPLKFWLRVSLDKIKSKEMGRL